jgi:serpin B
MMIILPDAGNFESFESTLTAERYDEIRSMMQWQMIELYMPKFTFETALGLKETLVEMGMQDAFDTDLANFAGMDGEQILYLDKVFHKALITVDEKGTEAAASTAAIVAPASLVTEWVTVTMDRPFFYMIRDIPTGTILFMGRVVDPR